MLFAVGRTLAAFWAWDRASLGWTLGTFGWTFATVDWALATLDGVFDGWALSTQNANFFFDFLCLRRIGREILCATGGAFDGRVEIF